MENNEARLNITFGGQNGDLPDPIAFDASDADVKAWAAEAVRNGSIPGIQAAAEADFHDFVVDRFAATEARPFQLVQLRPKTAYGA
jgi:hypothetical protein